MLLDQLKGSTALLAAIKSNGNAIESQELNLWLCHLLNTGYLRRVDYCDRDGKYQIDYVLTTKAEERLHRLSEEMLNSAALRVARRRKIRLSNAVLKNSHLAISPSG